MQILEETMPFFDELGNAAANRGWRLENSYAQLPNTFSAPVTPVPCDPQRWLS